MKKTNEKKEKPGGLKKGASAGKSGLTDKEVSSKKKGRDDEEDDEEDNLEEEDDDFYRDDSDEFDFDKDPDFEEFDLPGKKTSGKKSGSGKKPLDDDFEDLGFYSDDFGNFDDDDDDF
ncbi:MAG TPA: hypothetical protein VFL76_00445 [Edaphocola sp.]|nr:hypothetical protein [Edaphocola sp.]